MKISTRVLAALMALGVCAFAIGCGQEQKVVDPKGAEVIKKVTEAPVRAEFAPLGEIKDGRKNIYAVVKTLRSSYWKEVVKGLEAGGKEANANIYMGASLREIDWQSQKALIDSIMDKKVDAVVMAPADSTNMVPVVQALKAKKIPVVLLDTALYSEDYDAGFMTNNVVAGMKAGEEMLKLLKKNGAKETDELVVRIQLSSQTSSTMMDRLDGLNSFWTEKAPKTWKLNKMLLVDQGDNQMTRKMSEKALKTDKIRGIIALNNSPTVAATETIEKMNRKDVVVVGFDYAPTTARVIANPDYKVASIVQNQHMMAVEAVKAATAIANGGKASGKVTDTGINVISNENYKAYEASLKK